MNRAKEVHRVVIWGASGHALVVADILRLLGYRIEGFLDNVAPNRCGKPFGGHTVLGGVEQLPRLKDSGIDLIAMGIGNNTARLSLTEIALGAGFSLPSVVHPRATIAANAELGAGTIVAAGAVINPACRIGNNVIVNTAASIDHECIVGDGAHIAPGVRMAGEVVVGRTTFIGVGSIVKDRVCIGSGAVVGAGSLVLHDIPDSVVAYGVPAKVVRFAVDETIS